MTDTEAPRPTPGKHGSRPWVRVLLIVSLAVNLMIAGAVVGLFWTQGPGDSRRAPSSDLVRDLGLGPYLRALADTDRTALRAAALERRGALRGGREEMRAALMETLALLRAETLDSARFRAAIDRQADIADRGRQLGQSLLVERVEQMSVAERRDLADRLEKGLRRYRHGQRWRDKEERPSND